MLLSLICAKYPDNLNATLMYMNMLFSFVRSHENPVIDYCGFLKKAKQKNLTLTNINPRKPSKPPEPKP